MLWLKLVRDSTQCFKSFFYCLPIFSLFSFFLFSLSFFLSILPSYLTLSCSFFQSTFSIFLSFLLSLFLPSYLTLSRSFFQSTFYLFVPFLFLSFFACVRLFHHYFQFGFWVILGGLGFYDPLILTWWIRKKTQFVEVVLVVI